MVLCAGHASAVLQNRWYILGGGNNARGCTNMVSLDLAPLVSSSSAAEPQVCTAWTKACCVTATPAVAWAQVLM